MNKIVELLQGYSKTISVSFFIVISNCFYFISKAQDKSHFSVLLNEITSLLSAVKKYINFDKIKMNINK